MYPIEKLIQDWCNECNVGCMTRLNYNDKIVNIITNRPGIMIGYKGNLVNKYREKIKEYGWKTDIMEAQEIHYPGNDWEKIIDERALGYFETETEEYDDFEEYDGLEYEIDDTFEEEN